MADDRNPPAFPSGWGDAECGMTLRDWFAGQALIGIVAAERYGYADGDAQEAYEIADAMLAERERQP